MDDPEDKWGRLKLTDKETNVLGGDGLLETERKGERSLVGKCVWIKLLGKR